MTRRMPITGAEQGRENQRMPGVGQNGWRTRGKLLVAVGIVSATILGPRSSAQEEETLPSFPLVVPVPSGASPTPFTGERVGAWEKPMPINLPTALHLAGVRPLDIAAATERLRLAAAELDRAKVLWLPTLQWGVDYFRHDGRIQDVAGNLFDTSKSTFMAGVAPIAV